MDRAGARRQRPAGDPRDAELFDIAQQDAAQHLHLISNGNRFALSPSIPTGWHAVPVADNQHSLKAGLRGPTLLEDFLLREKITHFDHERIPERVVHARGSGAHGYFEPYRSHAKLTKAA